MHLRYTLYSEGTSDSVLLPILDWILTQAGIDLNNFRGEWADLRQRRELSARTLENKLAYALQLYPCDLLFVHRDADRNSLDTMRRRIFNALNLTRQNFNCQMPSAVCVVPVKMTEAWLLFDEQAIRKASGNKNGTVSLDLPPLRDLENLSRPKETLVDLLKCASELRGRRLRQLEVCWCKSRITQFITDFTPLRSLEAFRILEQDVIDVLKNNPQLLNN